MSSPAIRRRAGAGRGAEWGDAKKVCSQATGDRRQAGDRTSCRMAPGWVNGVTGQASKRDETRRESRETAAICHLRQRSTGATGKLLWAYKNRRIPAEVSPVRISAAKGLRRPRRDPEGRGRRAGGVDAVGTPFQHWGNEFCNPFPAAGQSPLQPGPPLQGQPGAQLKSFEAGSGGRSPFQSPRRHLMPCILYILRSCTIGDPVLDSVFFRRLCRYSGMDAPKPLGFRDFQEPPAAPARPCVYVGGPGPISRSRRGRRHRYFA